MSGFEDKSVLKAKYRNRTEIIASVLEAAKGVGISETRTMFTAYLSYKQLKEYLPEAASKTRIMFIAYLSYEQLNEYMNELLDKELLTYDLHTRTYNITSKGSKFLELYAELEKVE